VPQNDDFAGLDPYSTFTFESSEYMYYSTYNCKRDILEYNVYSRTYNEKLDRYSSRLLDIEWCNDVYSPEEQESMLIPASDYSAGGNFSKRDACINITGT